MDKTPNMAVSASFYMEEGITCWSTDPSQFPTPLVKAQVRAAVPFEEGYVGEAELCNKNENPCHLLCKSPKSIIDTLMDSQRPGEGLPR